VTDTDDGRQALATAVEVGERLGLRLVLAHVAEGIAARNHHEQGSKGVRQFLFLSTDIAWLDVGIDGQSVMDPGGATRGNRCQTLRSRDRLLPQRPFRLGPGKRGSSSTAALTRSCRGRRKSRCSPGRRRSS